MSACRVLLVDDTVDFLEVSREYLEGFAELDIVGTATSGRQALDLLPSLRPDVMVADISMPEMNGIELARRARETFPALKIVILSLMDSPAQQDAASQVGADAFISKTAMDTELVPTIQRLFR